MKILETITDLNLSSGGAVTSTLNSYGLLQKRSIDIDMVTLLPYSDDDSYLGEGYDSINALPFDGKTQFVYSNNLKRGEYYETRHTSRLSRSGSCLCLWL